MLIVIYKLNDKSLLACLVASYSLMHKRRSAVDWKKRRMRRATKTNRKEF